MKQLNDRKDFRGALTLFEKSPKPSLSSQAFVQAIKACTYLRDFQRGSTIHNHFSSTHPKIDNYVLVSLIIMYGQCGRLIIAEQIFKQSKNKNLAMYAAMMKGYIKQKMAKKAIDLFETMPKKDEVIVTLLFNACAQLGTREALQLGKKVIDQMPIDYQKDPYVLVAAFDMFIKCGDLSSAESLFRKMKRSIVSYGNLMKVYNEQRSPKKTLNLYKEMKIERLQGDLVTFLLVINACAQIGVESISQPIVSEIPSSIEKNPYIQASLIDMWGKVSSVDRAKEIFESIANRDVVIITAMINGYAVNGMGLQALEVFHRMPKELINEYTYVCVLNACSHSGLVQQARSIFAGIKVKTAKIFTVMVDCLSRSFLFDEARQLIDEYERDHPPDLVMYTALLSSARNDRNSSLSQETFDRMQKLFPHCEQDLTSALILLANTYALTGEFGTASNIRKRVGQSSGKKQVGISWTSVNGKDLVEFRAHDQSHSETSQINAEVQRMADELLQYGHEFDASWIIRALDGDETIQTVLCGHSERLALAYNFIQRPVPSKIQITKNLRICGDCHRAIKLIALIRQKEIIIRDAYRIHHFHPTGQCSCQDFF